MPFVIGYFCHFVTDMTGGTLLKYEARMIHVKSRSFLSVIFFRVGSGGCIDKNADGRQPCQIDKCPGSSSKVQTVTPPPGRFPPKGSRCAGFNYTPVNSPKSGVDNGLGENRTRTRQ